VGKWRPRETKMIAMATKKICVKKQKILFTVLCSSLFLDFFPFVHICCFFPIPITPLLACHNCLFHTFDRHFLICKPYIN